MDVSHRPEMSKPCRPVQGLVIEALYGCRRSVAMSGFLRCSAQGCTRVRNLQACGKCRRLSRSKHIYINIYIHLYIYICSGYKHLTLLYVYSHNGTISEYISQYWETRDFRVKILCHHPPPPNCHYTRHIMFIISFMSSWSHTWVDTYSVWMRKFPGVPGCSRMFPDVPGCSRMFPLLVESNLFPIIANINVQFKKKINISQIFNGWNPGGGIGPKRPLLTFHRCFIDDI